MGSLFRSGGWFNPLGTCSLFPDFVVVWVVVLQIEAFVKFVFLFVLTEIKHPTTFIVFFGNCKAELSLVVKQIKKRRKNS